MAKKYQIMTDHSRIITRAIPGDPHPERPGEVLANVYRIRRLHGPAAGALGGWIEHEGNLSQCGDCWVDDGAVVFAGACVSDAAVVRHNAVVYGAACVREFAEVRDFACVADSALVDGRARVCGSARVAGRAHVTDDAHVGGQCVVDGSGCFIGGFTYLAGRVRVCAPAVALRNIALDGEYDVVSHTYGVAGGTATVGLVVARNNNELQISPTAADGTTRARGRVERIPRRTRGSDVNG